MSERWRCSEPPLPRNQDFIDRDSELRVLWQVLRPQPGPRRTCVVSGPAGSGKTQLALEYLYRYGHHYGHCLWVNKNAKIDKLVSFSGVCLWIIDDPIDELRPAHDQGLLSEDVRALLQEIPVENTHVLLTSRTVHESADVQLSGLPSEDALRWLQDALPASWQGWYNAPLLALYQAVRGWPFPLAVLRRILRHGYRTPEEIWRRVQQQGVCAWLDHEIRRNPSLSYCPEEALPLALAVLQ